MKMNLLSKFIFIYIFCSLSNVTPYAFYTICLGVMGYLVQKVSNLVELQQLSVVEIEEIIEESENADEDYENLLKEIQTQ